MARERVEGLVRLVAKASAQAPGQLARQVADLQRMPAVSVALRLRAQLGWSPRIAKGASPMGKYFLAWVLGVPAVVLVAVYFFMH
jgi:hypothetical protein